MKVQELSKINNLLLFTKETLRQFEKDPQRLDFNLKYWVKKGKIITLKNGLFVLKDKWEREPEKNFYAEYLANKIYEPSYLSMEYVLNLHSLLTEGTYSITSATTLATKDFENSLGRFYYYSLSPALFCGYEIKKFHSSYVLIATKPKAIFDYLYLRFYRNAKINKKELGELRINWENLSRKEFSQAKAYIKSAKSKKIKHLFNLIKESYYA